MSHAAPHLRQEMGTTQWPRLCDRDHDSLRQQLTANGLHMSHEIEREREKTPKHDTRANLLTNAKVVKKDFAAA
jgi:hypothetical protein